jgi:hypothetical protein
MYARRLIYLSAHQITAFSWQAGVLSDEGSFEATEAGKQRFANYLAHHSKSIFSILANVSDESFHIEMIPFLRGADRSAIIARKLGQLFFNATLTTSISLGHEKSRRKNERIMLAALTNNELFAPWLDSLARAGAALAGIYSLPLLGPLLLRKLGVSDERCLLLTVQDQSIRQSYLEKGELHFSRLVPLPNSGIGGIAQTFAAEARKLQQYLVSQRVMGRQQPIKAYLLAHASARQAVEDSCVDSESLSFAIFDVEDCAHRCGLKALPPDTRCEALFLHLLATAPPTHAVCQRPTTPRLPSLARSLDTARGRCCRAVRVPAVGRQAPVRYLPDQPGSRDHQFGSRAVATALRRHRHDFPADPDQQRESPSGDRSLPRTGTGQFLARVSVE